MQQRMETISGIHLFVERGPFTKVVASINIFSEYLRPSVPCGKWHAIIIELLQFTNKFTEPCSVRLRML